MAPTTYNNIQILVPGKPESPGSADRKIHIPSSARRPPGDLFQATVRAVDRYFNVTPYAAKRDITGSPTRMTTGRRISAPDPQSITLHLHRHVDLQLDVHDRQRRRAGH